MTLVGLSEKIKGMKRREGRVLPSWKYAGALMGQKDASLKRRVRDQ